MGKKILFYMILLVLVFALAGVSYGWQGRMGGMGDPFGLVADESDYLIHPAKIANGAGVKFYGDYRFTFTGVTEWKDHTNFFTPGGAFTNSIQADVDGEEVGHYGLVGAAYPLGPGRMGLFFTYDGMRGGYDGVFNGVFFPEAIQMKNDLDDFALRLLYGLPIGSGFKLGGEFQLAYRQELQELNDSNSLSAFLNDTFFPYPFPNKSRYWEALFKGSMDGKVGPLDLEFTLRGGFDFAGTSKWDFQVQIPPGTLFNGWNTKGDVEGWQIGGDLWLRYPLASDLTLPMLVRVDYRHKTRDGDGPEIGAGAGNTVGFQDVEKSLAITVGGGVDKEFGKATRIAAGIYYNYLRGKEDFTQIVITPLVLERFDDIFPDSVEHQVLLRLAGEHTFSPTVALRTGLSFFYGWVTPKDTSSSIDTTGAFDILKESGSGSHWGIGGWFGGTVQVKPLTLEPFVGGGYQVLRLKMNGSEANNSGVFRLLDDRMPRKEWFVSTGLSILFGL